MVSAGSATVAFAEESTYMGSLVDSDSDGTTDYYLPLKNPTLGDFQFSNNPTRERDPGDVEPDGSIAQNFEGSVSISGELATSDWHSLVWNSGGTGFADGRMPSSTWFFGVNHLDGTHQEKVTGAVVEEATISWTQGENMTLDLSLMFGSAEGGGTITPSNIQKPALGDVQPFHGAQLDVDGTRVEKLQSWELTITTNARFHRDDSSRKPVDAVIGNVETDLSMDAIFTGPTNTDIARGGSTPASMLSSVNGTITATNGNATTLTYNLTDLYGNTVSWANLINGDEDLTQTIDWQVSGVAPA